MNDKDRLHSIQISRSQDRSAHTQMQTVYNILSIHSTHCGTTTSLFVFNFITAQQCEFLTSNMCYNGKCMHCIDVETGSLIFAIISVVLTGLGILVTIGALVYVNVMIAAASHAEADPDSIRMAIAASFTANVTLGVLLCLIVVPFAFTIVLIKGLVQKKAAYVKIYFIYAVICKSLALVGAVVGMASGRYSPLHAITVLAVIAIYVLILRMIYLTYKKLEVDAQFDRTKLVEQKY
ncbi:uncharacterized protein LOC120631420 isoform X1 [Pararge aegeria]|uniref:uncharacterized protein LOC120631420 isoform X1 n=1 Tax=Pararge aegeria TaxID=116150 RepID=UPI0019D175EF|nr:uncharacterized protein LOC120631420 isoform X1 [Pararge aegeria]